MKTPTNFEDVVTMNTCRWLGGDLDKNEYCGAKRAPGKSYCVKHHEQSYRKAQKNRKELTE